MRASAVLGAFALLVVAAATALVLSEAAVRVLDGKPLLSARLPPVKLGPIPPPRQLDPTLGGAAVPVEVDPAWINEYPPAPPRGRVDAEDVRRAQLGRDLNLGGYVIFRVWNRLFAEAMACAPGSLFQRLPQPLLVFDPPEPMAQPVFRYPPSRRLPGLLMNRFGWRGPDVPIDKPPGTVRIAFAGASTTFGLPAVRFTYPEYVIYWLNRWADRTGASVRFDGVNAGREGMSSPAIAAVIRQEVMPLEPDLVLYYEGANQSLCTRPPPRFATRPQRGAVGKFVDSVVAATREHSQLARRLEEAALRWRASGGYEPAKPEVEIDWPENVDEAHPDITARNLGVEGNILRDLDSARVPLEASGSELALSSFAWLVHDGLWLDPKRDLTIYRHLNEGCWPYRYADLRRSLDLHNHVLEQYAAAHQLPFIDVAQAFPPDPTLFFDGVHLNSDGTRVHAWIVFRALLPIIRARLDSGIWPRADRLAQSEHPAFTAGEPFAFSCDGRTLKIKHTE